MGTGMEFKYEDVEFLGSRYSDVTRNVMGHRHKYYELNFLTRGKTKMRINGRDFEYGSYDFILIPPMMTHLLYESEYATFDNYVIWFQVNEEQMLTYEIIKLHDYDGAVQFLCSQIYKTYTATGMENAELINLYLKTVLCHMKKGVILSTNAHTDSSESMIEQAVRYINTNIFERQLTVGDVSRIFNISPEHFSRSFKKKIGTAPVQYMNEMRVAEAKRLLSEKDLSVKEISAKLFYTDSFYFSKQFRKITGYSPSEYRRSIKK